MLDDGLTLLAGCEMYRY